MKLKIGNWVEYFKGVQRYNEKHQQSLYSGWNMAAGGFLEL